MLINTNTPAAGSRILGLGHYQPSNVVTNEDLVARGVDTDDAWIRSRVGIAERRFADPDETVVDMGEAAASKALAAGGVATGDVDLVIVATCTMPSPVPSAAPQLAHRLGIEAPGAYDVNSGCSGFTYSLNIASAAILSGQARTVLVVGLGAVLRMDRLRRPLHLRDPRRWSGCSRGRTVGRRGHRPGRVG